MVKPIRILPFVIAIILNITPTPSLAYGKHSPLNIPATLSANEMLHIGRGTVEVIHWQPMNNIVIGGSQGVWIYSSSLEDIKHFENGAEPVTTLSISPHSTKIASANKNRSTIQIRDVETGKVISMLNTSGEVQSIAWSPDGKKLASADITGKVTIWDGDAYNVLAESKEHEERINSLAWSPDSTKLASSSWDNTVKIWNTADEHGTIILSGHTEDVIQVAWNADGTKLASIGYLSDKIGLIIWDTSTYQSIFSVDNFVPIKAIAWRPNSDEIAGITGGGKIQIWNATSGKVVSSLQTSKMAIGSFAWNPDGKTLVTVDQDYVITTWDVTKSESLKQLKLHTRPVDTVRWNPKNNQLAVTYQEQTDILVLDASTGLLQKTLKTPDSVAQSLGVSDLLWSPDGKFLASAFEDNVINVWSMDNKSLEAPLSLSLPNSLPSLAWNPDSRTLISVSGIAEKRKVSVWDVIRGKQKSVLDTQGTQIVSAMWSPNGKLLMLYTKEGIIQIWDAQTQKTIKTFPSLVSNDTLPWGILSWHPDSNRIAGISCDRVSGKCVLWMWNLTSNEVVTPFEQVSIISTINEMVWSPDGKKLASSDGYKTVYIWDISGKLLSTLIGNLDTIKAISWNSDSNRLVTGSMDGSIRIWELR